jgi:hypothetical protein
MPALLGMATLPFLSQTLGSGFLMGIGYTGGAYTGYAGFNTADPIGWHSRSKHSSYKGQQISLDGMSYGSYGRRSYGRYRRYRGYRRRPYYRRYRRSYY